MASKESKDFFALSEVEKQFYLANKYFEKLGTAFKESFNLICEKINDLENRIEHLEERQNTPTVITTIPTQES